MCALFLLHLFDYVIKCQFLCIVFSSFVINLSWSSFLVLRLWKIYELYLIRKVSFLFILSFLTAMLCVIFHSLALYLSFKVRNIFVKIQLFARQELWNVLYNGCGKIIFENSVAFFLSLTLSLMFSKKKIEHFHYHFHHSKSFYLFHIFQYFQYFPFIGCCCQFHPNNRKYIKERNEIYYTLYFFLCLIDC